MKEEDFQNSNWVELADTKDQKILFLKYNQLLKDRFGDGYMGWIVEGNEDDDFLETRE
jgi:hypothetical protein